MRGFNKAWGGVWRLYLELLFCSLKIENACVTVNSCCCITKLKHIIIQDGF